MPARAKTIVRAVPAYVRGAPSWSFGPDTCEKLNDIGQLIRICRCVPRFSTIVRFGPSGCESTVPHTWQPCTTWTIAIRTVGEAIAAGASIPAAPAARTKASLFTSRIVG